MTGGSLYSWEPREAEAESGKSRQASAHAHPIPLIPLVLCHVANNILLCVMEGNTDIEKKNPVVDNFIFRPWLKNLISTSKKPGNKWHQRPQHKVLSLFPMVATALPLSTQFIVLSCHSGSEGPFTGLSLARQGYCFCLFFFLVDKSGSDGDINFLLPVFSCV